MNDKELSPFGIVFSIIALIVFSIFIYSLVGWWFLLLSPIVTLFAIRPVKEEGCFLFERYKNANR